MPVTGLAYSFKCFGCSLCHILVVVVVEASSLDSCMYLIYILHSGGVDGTL